MGIVLVTLLKIVLWIVQGIVLGIASEIESTSGVVSRF